MQIDAFIADSVATADGKLYAMGAGWDRLATRQFPARHPRLGLGMIISVGYNETEQDHTVLVRLEIETAMAAAVAALLAGGVAMGVRRELAVG